MFANIYCKIFGADKKRSSKHKNAKDGLQSNCRQCGAESSKQWKLNNPEKNKESHQKTFKKH